MSSNTLKAILPKNLKGALNKYVKVSQELQAFLVRFARCKTKQDFRNLGDQENPENKLCAVFDDIIDRREDAIEGLGEELDAFFEEPEETFATFPEQLRTLHHMAKLAENDLALYERTSIVDHHATYANLHQVTGNASGMVGFLSNTTIKKSEVFCTFRLNFKKAFVYYYFYGTMLPSDSEVSLQDLLETISLSTKSNPTSV